MSYFRNISRSLFAKMTLLSLVFFVLAIVYTVILPVREWTSERDPMIVTEGIIRNEVWDAFDDEVGELDDITELDGSGIIRSAMRENPHLRLYVEQGDRSWSAGGSPKWRDVVNFDHPDLVLPENAQDDACRGANYSAMSFKDDHGTGRIFSRECNGEQTYFEISGIENPIPEAQSWKTRYPPEFIWVRVKEHLIVSVGIILIAFLVLGLALRSLRKVTDVAESFNPEAVEHKLPESGLPTEVRPLIQAVNSLLDKVNESREQQRFFLATAAHEIRTPLAIMRARLEDVPEGTTKDDLRSDVRRLSGLVEDLLRLISVRNQGVPEQQVDLVALARKVVEQRAPYAIECGVDLGLDADIENYLMAGDERLLLVAVSNLVDNAISFSEEGGSVEVVVGNAGKLSVQDHGPGVPADTRESIFEPFAKNPPNRKGHGLGLAIVKAVVSLHRGEIQVEDTEGGGATFELQF